MEVYEVGNPTCNIHTIEELVETYRQCGGYMAKNVYKACRIMLDMFTSNEIVILSFPADIIATGIRSIIADFLRRGFADIVITTAGTLDHDIARAFGGKYISHKFDVDDSKLRDEGFHRIGNILVKIEHYGPIIENFIHNFLSKLTRDGITKLGIRRLLYLMGRHIEDENSIVKICSINKIPIYVFGYVDGAFGTAILTYNEVQRSRVDSKKVIIDLYEDERELEKIFSNFKDVGCIIIGGGVSGRHVEYIIDRYVRNIRHLVTILSTPYERVNVRCEKGTTIYSDATIIIPILFSYIVAKLKNRERKLLECLEW